MFVMVVALQMQIVYSICGMYIVCSECEHFHCDASVEAMKHYY